MRSVKFLKRFAGGAVGLAAALAMAGTASAADKKYQFYLSLSYVGNGWQTQAQNMMSAMAKYYSDKVDFHIQASGPVAQRQIQQINSMVQAGANAIIVYPISPTALNAAIKNACDKGVLIFTYDSTVTEPCGYNVHPDNEKMAASEVEWLAKKLNGKGNILLVTGVPGTDTDNKRTKGYKETLAKYPDMKIVGSVNGMWSLAVTEKVISEFMATHKWSEIDGVLGSGGGWSTWQQETAQGVKPLTPYAADGANATRVAMLPVGSIPDATPPYAPMGAVGMSVDASPGTGTLAFKLALQILEGDKSIPHDTIVNADVVTSDNIRLCKEASWKEMRDGCNVFDPKLVNPDFTDIIYNKDTPEIGLKAAMFGEPEPRDSN